MKNSLVKPILWTLISGLTITKTSAQISQGEIHQFTVAQAVEYAIKNSVQVKNSLLDVRKAEQVNREYTSYAYPQLNGSAGINYYPKVPVSSFPNFISLGTYEVLVNEGVKDGNGVPIKKPDDYGFINAQFGTKYTASAGVELSQILFDGQVFVGLQARSTNLKLAQKNVEITQDIINANIQKIYFQLVIGKMQMAKVDANITLLEKLLHDTKEIYKNGFAEKLDVDKTTVALTNLQTEKIKIQNSLDAGNASLKFLMGMPQQDKLELSDTLTEAFIKEDLLDDTYNYKDRKEVQALELANKLNAYNVRRYKLGYVPSIVAFGQYSKNAQRNSFNIFDFSNQWFTTSIFGIKINAPLFDGFLKSARIKQAEIELKKTNNLLENVRQSVDMEVQQSRWRLKNAILTIDAQLKNMELAESVYNQTKKKYEQGLGSNLEITNAWKDLQVAQSDYYSALYDAVIAKVDFHKAIGKLK
ncbi:MAG TPA: TolC family protein [Chitinophagaceae bacterium]|nr:TolC family protein [Chitinophagaceae bacterium]